MGKRKTELKPTRKGKSKKAKDGEVKGQGARKRERKGERKGQKDGKGAPFTLDLVYARTFTGVARIERRRRSIAPAFLLACCPLSAFHAPGCPSPMHFHALPPNHLNDSQIQYFIRD